jgi:hypothetical protein
MRHINEPPPLVRDKRPDVPPRVEALVQRAMAKDPADRFQTMADLCAEIDACLAELGGATQVIAPASASPRRVRPGHSSAWPIVLALLVLIVAGAIVGYLLLHRSGGHGPSNGRPPVGTISGTVPLKAVTAYDPYGSPPGQENNSAAPRATDASASTYWETEHYRSSFALLHKPGVGLVLDVLRPLKLRQLGIATGTPGFHAVIKAGDSASGPFPDVVSSPVVVGSGSTIALTVSTPHRYYLIWITQLPSNQPPNQQSVQINDVKATAG